MTTTGAPEAVENLAAGLRGDLIAPGAAAYDEARLVWNGTVDRRPALIVRPLGVADVIDTVNFARERGMRVTVRGGGHHVAGGAVSDGGLVIDLALMRCVRVDPRAQTVRAEGGARLGDLDRETQAFGLAVPAGVVSDTGIAGLSLAGGVGWLRRTFGLTCDNILSADIVTADGQLLTASAHEHEDLFWALRGGGWKLGVVMSLEYRAHRVGPGVMFVLVFYPARDAREVFQCFRSYGESSPDEVNTLAFAGTVPAEPAYPEELHGEAFAAVGAVYAGGVEDGRRVLQPLRELGAPMLDLSAPAPFVDVQKALDEDYPSGRRYYWKSVYLRGLGDDVIDTLLDLSARRPSPLTTIDIWHQGGAIARVRDGETPIAHRGAPYMIGIESNWEEPDRDADNVAWARGAAEALRPFSTGGSYLNFEDVEGEKGAAEASFGKGYVRLMEIKRKYDPDGLFGER